MEKEFIPFEFAFKLNKELGFDEECFGYYFGSSLQILNGNIINTTNLSIIKAPLWQQAFDFMAFKYNIHGNVITTGKDKIYMSSEYREGYGGTKSNGGTYTDIYDCRIDLLEDMIQLWKNK